MQNIKVILAVVKSDFAGWMTNYKMYVAVIIMLIFSLDNYTTTFAFAKENEYRVTPFLFPFLLTHPFMKFVIYMCIIFLFSNAPFTNSLQMLMMSRAGKRRWYLSQMIYLGISSAILELMLIIVPIIRNINMIVWKADWGKIWTTLAVNEVINPANYFTINHYSAMQAMLYSVVIFFLITLFIGMGIMFCNTAFQNKSIGIAIMAALVVIQFMEHLTDQHELLWISPFSWDEISKMAYGRDLSTPTILYAIIFLSVANMVLFIGTYFIAGKKDFMVIAEED